MDHPDRKLPLFEQTMMPHLNAAYNLARWLTRDSHEAEDLVQESFLRAFRSFDTFRGNDARAWLLAIVRNGCFTWLKRKNIHSVEDLEDHSHAIADDAPDAEAVLINRAALGSLNTCLETLPVEFREVVVLRELEEMSYQEISQVARVPVGTVMSRLARGRKRLQECMAGAIR